MGVAPLHQSFIDNTGGGAGVGVGSLPLWGALPCSGKEQTVLSCWFTCRALYLVRMDQAELPWVSSLVCISSPQFL